LCVLGVSPTLHHVRFLLLASAGNKKVRSSIVVKTAVSRMCLFLGY
jgi:hypothetical protein